jgi:hypothetical protein
MIKSIKKEIKVKNDPKTTEPAVIALRLILSYKYSICIDFIISIVRILKYVFGYPISKFFKK